MIADAVELLRLCKMNVLVEGNKDQLDASNTLTTKFVYDWRLKDRVQRDGSSCKAWLCRSRVVAREFVVFGKSVQTRNHLLQVRIFHILNVLPMMYLQNLVDVPNNTDESSKVCLGTLDVKDAFLMVDQPSPMLVSLLGREDTVCKNLPGQHLGAKSWYWHLRDSLSTEMSFEWCREQPCLAKNSQCCIMVHVDDILYCGDGANWHQIFLPKSKVYKVSPAELKGIGSEISFLKRRKDWRFCQAQVLSVLWSSTSSVLGRSGPKPFRVMLIFRWKTKSDKLPHKDAFSYRSIVGAC